MEKVTREELIATLVTDKYSGFKNGDEPQLATASDVRLEEFRSASEARRQEATRVAQMENDQRQTAARLKVAEERIVEMEKPMSDEAFVARLAPTSPIKGLLEARAAEEASLKSSLVAALKDLGGKTEEELKKMSIPDLQTLAQYARVKVLDYSGKGMPVERTAAMRETVAAPKPWTMALAQQKAS